MADRKPLVDCVAVVAGATRGAGRGIARALGEAGAAVYCTGRSVRGNPSPYNRPETIEETADLVTAAGGTGMAIRVDHTIEEEVRALFQRVQRERKRLDLLVSSIAGEDPLLGGWTTFWKTDLQNASAATARPRKRGVSDSRKCLSLFPPSRQFPSVTPKCCSMLSDRRNPGVMAMAATPCA